MDIDSLLNYLEQYGIYFLCLIFFLENLNVPGLPAGVIMPAVGALIDQGKISFFPTFIASVVASLGGSFVLYAVGYFFGYPLLNKLSGRYQRTQRLIDKLFNYFDRYGNKSVFILRLVPVARTFVSLVAGVTRLDLKDFLLYSGGGIFIWNFALIYFGFVFSDLFL